jgi:hypothetical protein
MNQDLRCGGKNMNQHLINAVQMELYFQVSC